MRMTRLLAYHSMLAIALDRGRDVLVVMGGGGGGRYLVAPMRMRLKVAIAMDMILGGTE